MKYIELQQPLKADPSGPKFLHAIEFLMKGIRYNELEQFVTEIAGDKHEGWRVQARCLDNSHLINPNTGSKYPEKFVIRFVSKDHAMMFKLSWDCCVPTTSDSSRLNKVLLPIIRRAMPSLLAQEIIGVQPMTGPVASLHTLNVKYPEPKPPRALPNNEAMDEWESYRSVDVSVDGTVDWDTVKTAMLTKNPAHMQDIMEQLMEDTRKALEEEYSLSPSKKSSTDTSGNDQ